MIRFANNASAPLASSITATATTITLAGGFGSKFPTLVPPDTFQATIYDPSGVFEIVTCTARAGDVLTVVRGREGSTPRAWDETALVENRITAEALHSFLQITGGSMAGPLDLAGNQLLNAVLPSTLPITTLQTTLLRPFDNNPAYELRLPNGGGLPTLGGPSPGDRSFILRRKDLRYIVMMYSGPVPVPAPFVLCNGANGTPDLRGRFIIGSGIEFELGDKSADRQRLTTIKSAAAGAQAAGVTGSTALTVAQMPAHTHAITGRQTSGNNTGTAHAGTTGAAIADGTTGSTGGGEGHTHTTPAIPNHQHDVPLPAYYALAFVMFNPNLL